MKSSFLYATCLFILSGCIPDPLEVSNVPQLTPRIVVSSQVIPGQSLAVLLTKSIGALDAGSSTNAQALLASIVVNDAVVTIAWNGGLDTLDFVDNGIYGSVSVPFNAGEEYTLVVNSKALGVVTAKTIMYPQVPFDSVSAKLHVADKDTTAVVYYRLTDPPGKNWYMLNVQRYRRARDYAAELNPRIYIKLLDDDDFKASVQEEFLNVPFRRFSAGDTVAVVLASISEGYYKYLSQRLDDRNDLSEFVSEPLNLPSNVENGYGYFNLQVPDARLFKLH